MNASRILNFSKTIFNCGKKSLPVLSSGREISKFSLPQSSQFVNFFSSYCRSPFVPLSFTNNATVFNPMIIPFRGLKVQGRLRLRCKNCYFERKDGRMYVSCTSYPRHKQMAMVKKEKYTWIISHCCQSKKRPY